MTSGIIILNGTSSSGKTTIAKALRIHLPKTFCYYASDQLADAGFRQLDKDTDERQRFFDGFHRSIAAFAEAGNDLLIEHIIEEQSWAEDVRNLLKPFDTFRVGIHAPLEKLQRREKARGNRTIGEAEYHLNTHDFCDYDFKIDSSGNTESAAQAIANAWAERQPQ